jgi:hypothetical protein
MRNVSNVSRTDKTAGFNIASGNVHDIQAKPIQTEMQRNKRAGVGSLVAASSEKSDWMIIGQGGKQKNNNINPAARTS